MVPSKIELNKIRARRTPQTRPAPKKVETLSVAKIDYLLSDMALSTFTKKVDPPKTIYPPVAVKDYKGGGYVRGSVQSIAANAHVTIANTLSYVNQLLPNIVKAWPATYTLSVLPLAGIDLNAFYDRRSIQLFYYGNSKLGRTVYTADSSDIVAHELGHAILDSIRPQTWSSFATEVWAMHEAFADCVSFTNLLSHDEVINYVLTQNQHNFRNRSLLTDLAEDLGRAVAVLYPNSGYDGISLRNLLTHFNYVVPWELPYDGPDSVLTSQPHNFGRVWSGAIYELFVRIFEDTVLRGYPRINSIRHARDQVMQYLLMAIRYAPINSRYYDSVAKTMLWVDATYNARNYQTIMSQLFVERQIISPQFRIQAEENSDTMLVKTRGKIECRLDSLIPTSNPLAQFEVEIPHEKGYFCDVEGNITDEIEATKSEAVDSAYSMLNYLHDKKKVDATPRTPFEIRQGKIVRTHFSRR